jgi:Transglycosylase SLT domain
MPRSFERYEVTLPVALALLLALLAVNAGAQTPDLQDPSKSGQQAAVRPAANLPATPDNKAVSVETAQDLRRLAEEAAKANQLPADYFIRLIGYESRFNGSAVSPAGAQGIAQFMPSTAQERGLKNPFDPVEALPKSAALLSDLKKQFGNLGLAAAAYNAGPRRVQEWLDGRGHLPRETRLYVYAVTGRSAEDWAPPGAHLLRDSDGDVKLIAAVPHDLKGIDIKKNWELALLLSLPSGEAAKTAAVATAVELNNERNAGRRSAQTKYRSTSRLGSSELNLCSSCIVRNFY